MTAAITALAVGLLYLLATLLLAIKAAYAPSQRRPGRAYLVLLPACLVLLILMAVCRFAYRRTRRA